VKNIDALIDTVVAIPSGPRLQQGEQPAKDKSGSGLFCKAVSDLADRGKSLDDIERLMREGKHRRYHNTSAARYDREGRLRQEIERVLDKPRKRGAVQPSGGDNGLTSVRASEVKIKKVEWLWRDRFAIGKIGVIAGMPDQGKSQILLDMAARVSKGGEWPDGAPAISRNVVLLTAEDDHDDTVVPRLIAAGADLDRVVLIRMSRDGDGVERMVSLTEDLQRLEHKIAEVGNVGMLGIDPLTAYLGVKKMDSYRTTDVRGVLAPFATMAARMKFAAICVLHFNKNTSGANALHRVSDSAAFVAAPRHVYVAVPEAGSDRKLLLSAKNNLSPHGHGGLAYELAGKTIQGGVQTSHVVWGEGVDTSADDALAALKNATGRPSTEREQAKAFLSEVLSDGPVEARRIEQMAEARAITLITLKRAADDLGVAKSGAKGRAGVSLWSLPDADE
jgi:putative DNA primase/helicase